MQSFAMNNFAKLTGVIYHYIKTMKTILNILSKVIILIIISSILKSVFNQQSEIFKNSILKDTFKNDLFIPLILHFSLLILTGFLVYIFLRNITKNKKMNYIISGIFTLLIVIYYLITFSNLNSTSKINTISKPDKITKMEGFIEENSEEPSEYNYDEKLISFDYPFKLNQQNLEKNTFNNKSYFTDNYGIAFLELYGSEALEVTKDQSINEVISKFNDLSFPKFFIQTTFKKWFNKDVSIYDIGVIKIDENFYILTVNTKDDWESITYFNKKDNYFSLLCIINNKENISKAISLKTQDSFRVKSNDR